MAAEREFPWPPSVLESAWSSPVSRAPRAPTAGLPERDRISVPRLSPSIGVRSHAGNSPVPPCLLHGSHEQMMLITARLGLGQVETQSEFLDKTHTKEGVGHQYRGY